jgi:hypothetical protein
MAQELYLCALDALAAGAEYGTAGLTSTFERVPDRRSRHHGASRWAKWPYCNAGLLPALSASHCFHAGVSADVR